MSNIKNVIYNLRGFIGQIDNYAQSSYIEDDEAEKIIIEIEKVIERLKTGPTIIHRIRR